LPDAHEHQAGGEVASRKRDCRREAGPERSPRHLIGLEAEPQVQESQGRANAAV
jgi:hypothetical protein